MFAIIELPKDASAVRFHKAIYDYAAREGYRIDNTGKGLRLIKTFRPVLVRDNDEDRIRAAENDFHRFNELG